MTDRERENFDNSYSRMWTEIFRAREARDKAVKFEDASRDLMIAIRHDLGNDTMVSARTHEALKRAEAESD
jgi:hypothetical protein